MSYKVILYKNEPGHEKNLLQAYANIRGADLTPHPHSLISVVVRSLSSKLGLCLTWSEKKIKTGFLVPKLKCTYDIIYKIRNGSGISIFEHLRLNIIRP